MKFAISITTLITIVFLLSCSASRPGKSSGKTEIGKRPIETSVVSSKASEAGKSIPARTINTKNTDPDSVVNFAESLVGTRYKFGSSIKENGLDCSGFVTYVFKHFDIPVPRISRDFTNAGTSVPIDKSKKGDLILFTGTDTTGWVVGHMGFIIQNNNGKVKFIHSSSGKSIGVIISELSTYYASRFVKVIRVFDE